MNKITKLEYIWLDASGTPRSKTMIYQKEITTVDKLPLWNFDGSSTEQAETKVSDVIIRPVAMFNDPFRGAPHKLVLTECLNPDLSPHPSNNRAKAMEVFNKCQDYKPQYGIEQEYILFSRVSQPHSFVDHNGERKIEMANIPYKWFKHEVPGAGGQGPYYCSAGGKTAFGRHVAEEHLDKCLEAGIKICGLNAEVMASQWEFQVGICDDIEMGDHLHIARYILYRISEKYDIVVSFEPKPYKGDWNGSGLHTNYSTVQMREGTEGKTGLTWIKEACEKLCDQQRHEEHMKVYGLHNEDRLIGTHETASFTKCTWGSSDRSKSIRIPVLVVQNEQGYLEDRRVASNADPYLVTSIIAETTCL